MLLSSTLVNTLLWFANACLVAVFALAAVAKLRDRERAREGLIGFGVPERWTRPALVALIAVELLLAALLTYPPAQRVGAWGALGALGVFTLALAWQLLRGRRPTCACFGALTSAAIRWKSVGRNLLLMTLASALIALPGVGSLAILFAAFSWPAILATAWGIISAAWLLLLTRQNGRLLLRLEQLEQRAAGAIPAPALPAGPLRVGDLPPPLGLSDARDRPFDLNHVRGTPALLLFLDAACSHCQPLLARLRETTPTSRDTALIVISASAALRHNLPAAITVLVDPGWSTMTSFGLRGTPAAVTLDAAGTLARSAVHGISAVHAALDQVLSEEVRHELAPI
jgi:hypothetical protein